MILCFAGGGVNLRAAGSSVLRVAANDVALKATIVAMAKNFVSFIGDSF
jgi:hypothetical protein